ncbi:MAG: hypothetical protein R3E02_14495 [Blastomonas sp.]
MAFGRLAPLPRLFAATSLPLLMVLTVAPAHAQDGALEPRVKKIEAEVRALQRKVFPGGTDRFFEPEITAPQAGPRTEGTAANSAVSDLLLRVDALESQLAMLTSQTEENSFRLGQFEARLDALEASAKEAEQAEIVMESSAAAASGTGNSAALEEAASAPSEERIAGVSAIIKPETDDPGEDAYIYGYRLWEAKYFPEAEAQLEDTIKTYPRHTRASFTRNLLGRAYLDDGKPTKAATIFFDNYKKDPRGERAPDSLYFLGEALIALDKKAEACTAFKELAEVYPEVAEGRLASRLATGRRNAGCN